MYNDPVKEIEKRTQRYWYQDGIWEVAFGVVYLVLCGFFLLVRSQSWDGPMALVLLVVQMAVFVGIFTLMGRVVRFLKERITYTRTGYVAYRQPTGSRRFKRALRAGAISAVTGGLVGLTAAIQSAVNVMPLVVSAVMALGFFYIGYRFKLPRMIVVGLLTVVLGTLLALTSITEDLLAPILFGGTGLLMLISGTVTLLVYLRRTRPASDHDDYLAPDEPSGQF